MTGVICDRIVSTRIKGKVKNTLVAPTMFYGLKNSGDDRKMEGGDVKLC